MREPGLVHHVGEGLDVERLVAGRVDVGDIAGDRCLARFRPARVAGGEIEEIDGGQDAGSAADTP